VLLNTLLFVYSVLNVDINSYIKVQNLRETDYVMPILQSLHSQLIMASSLLSFINILDQICLATFCNKTLAC